MTCKFLQPAPPAATIDFSLNVNRNIDGDLGRDACG
jgi:hypothetical protein